MIDIVVPSESFENTRSRLLRWLKAAGEPVTAGEPLVEVETDKVTVEIPAPTSGILSETLKAADDEVEVGDLLGRISAVVGQAPADSAPAARRAQAPAISVAPGHDSSASLSPAVRRLLVERGLDPALISGSGSGGRITVEDVLRHSDTGGAVAPAPVDQRAEPGVTRVPHSATRRRIAERMVQSLLHTAPHVTTVFEADLTAVLAHRARHKAAFAADGVPLTLTAYFIAACVPAIRAVPEANARWTDDALELISSMDIGIATAVEGKGLFVPVLRDVAGRDLRSIATALADLAGRARADRLTPADVRGGTFTISNHGVSGSLFAAPIVINPPQSAILGIGKLERRAVVVDKNGSEAIEIHPRCYVSLTLDHRVMDGHQANHFLDTWVRSIEAWPG